MRLLPVAVVALIHACAFAPEEESRSLLAIQAGTEEPNCSQSHLAKPAHCMVIEGDFLTYNMDCVVSFRRYKCLSTQVPLYVVGEATTREVFSPDCQVCVSEYGYGNVTARYW